MLKRILLVLFMLSLAAPAQAWWPRGISNINPPPPSCPKPVDGNCIAGVAAGGLYYGAGTSGTTAGVAYLQQSGQGYATDVDYNRGGIEFGIGPNLLDAAMVQGSTITNGQYPGCGAYNGSSSPNPTWSCTFNDGTATRIIDGVHLKDTTLNITNDGRTHVVLSNMTFETGPNYCLANSTSLLSLLSSTNIEVDNYKVIEGSECSAVAELWGTPAATGAGLTQASTFTGTFIAGNGANPGALKVSSGTTTGTIYRKSFADWPGRFIGTCCSGAFSQFDQVLWVLTVGQGWFGTAHTSGNSSTLIIDSTDANSPSANPPTSACCWLSWNSTATAAHQGNFVTSCNTGAHTCQLSAAVNFATPTAVAIGARSCTGSGCDNAVLQMDSDYSGTIVNPVTITTGPIHDNNPIPFNISNSLGGTCVGFTSRFGFVIKVGYQIVSKMNCPIDNQSDYIEMEAGHIAYADLPSGSSGVLHIDDIIQQATSGSTSTISLFQRKYSTVWTSKYNAQGDLSCILCNYANGPGTNYQTTETLANWDSNMVVANTPINNYYDNGTGVTTGAGSIVRQLQQTFGTTNATCTSCSVTNNGDGTGNLHVTSKTGTINIGDYIKCSTSCGVAPTGPMQITAQVDASNWTTSFYHALSGTVTLGSYPGKMTTVTTNKPFIDTTGIGAVGPIFVDPDIPIGSYSCTNSKNLVTGASISGC